MQFTVNDWRVYGFVFFEKNNNWVTAEQVVAGTNLTLLVVTSVLRKFEANGVFTRQGKLWKFNELWCRVDDGEDLHDLSKIRAKRFADRQAGLIDDAKCDWCGAETSYFEDYVMDVYYIKICYACARVLGKDE